MEQEIAKGPWFVAEILHDSFTFSISMKAEFLTETEALSYMLACREKAKDAKYKTPLLLLKKIEENPPVQEQKIEVGKFYWVKHKPLPDSHYHYGWEIALCCDALYCDYERGLQICGDELTQDPANYDIRFPALPEPRK